ncbi:hypothetical protein [Roseateles sp.]|uniref:hypothetical protein n=1 Tax=Roseateles sp. TaxID=1971397 RepID=UPI00286B5B1C|nr:hypothetical protein [Roseateles sp.]
MKTRTLLKVIAAVELLTGLGLLLAPSLVAELLLGLPLGPGAPLVVGRVAGLALVAIGLICGLENMRDCGASPTGLLVGLLAYNGAVPLLLIHSCVTNGTSGIGLWPTVALHLAFTFFIATCLRSNSAGREHSAPSQAVEK